MFEKEEKKTRKKMFVNTNLSGKMYESRKIPANLRMFVDLAGSAESGVPKYFQESLNCKFGSPRVPGDSQQCQGASKLEDLRFGPCADHQPHTSNPGSVVIATNRASGKADDHT